MTFGKRLGHYRRAAKLTQAQLANRAGWELAQSRISQYEKGKREPTLSEIEKLAKILGVYPHILAFGPLPEVAAPNAKPPIRPKKRGHQGRGQKLSKAVRRLTLVWSKPR